MLWGALFFICILKYTHIYPSPWSKRSLEVNRGKKKEGKSRSKLSNAHRDFFFWMHTHMIIPSTIGSITLTPKVIGSQYSSKRIMSSHVFQSFGPWCPQMKQISAHIVKRISTDSKIYYQRIWRLYQKKLELGL